MSKQSYLEKLLDGEEVEWNTLEEVCEIKNGYTPSKSKKEFWEGGSIPWFRMDDIRQNGRILDDSLQKITREAIKSGKLFPADSIIMSTTATIGEHALITRDFLCNQQLTVLSIKDKSKKYLHYKYLFYYGFILSDLCRKNTNPGGFALIGTTKVKAFQIPIPYPDDPKKSLAEQSRIVSILDKFDALTNSISEGLPREINLRQKQYEYYRDLLLSFPKSAEVDS